jgi:Cu+-exporting ATPase
VNCVIFDKTGTLTIGKPVVVKTTLLKSMVLQDFYELIAATEVSFFPWKTYSLPKYTTLLL